MVGWVSIEDLPDGAPSPPMGSPDRVRGLQPVGILLGMQRLSPAHGAEVGAGDAAAGDDGGGDADADADGGGE